MCPSKFLFWCLLIFLPIFALTQAYSWYTSEDQAYFYAVLKVSSGTGDMVPVHKDGMWLPRSAMKSDCKKKGIRTPLKVGRYWATAASPVCLLWDDETTGYRVYKGRLDVLRPLR